MTKEQQKVYATKRWKELRKQVIADEPVCHWCRRRPSTQADHIVELARGGDPYERTNLVGSCQPCNSRRGAEYQSRANAARRGAQRGQSGQRVFGADPEVTPPPLFPLSDKTQGDRDGSSPIGPDGPGLSEIAPRLVTPVLGHESFGPSVIQWARDHLDLELMPWQQRVLNDMLTHHDGAFNHRFALVSVGRQNGKTKGVMAALIGWWLTQRRLDTGEPQNVMSVAHTLQVAEDVSKVLFPVLEERFGFKVYTTHGRREAYLGDDARWRVVSASESSGHGTSNDLIVCDEIWKIKRETIEGGLLSTQTARPAPFAFFTSTAGTQESEFFIRWREQGIQQIESKRPGRLYMAEWSPPPNSDPTDPKWWPWSNPAMGVTITEQELRDKLQFVERGTFVRDHCNQWTSALGSWIPHGTWEALEVADPMPAGGVLAVDTDMHDARYVGVRVAARVDGRLQVASEFVVESAEEMWAEIHRVMSDKTVRLALTPGLASICPLDLSRRMTDFGTRELNTYTAVVRNMILEGKIVHGGQMTLTEQVNRAVAGRTGATITLSSQKSPGPIEMARCMVAAAGLAAVPTANVRKPMIGSAR
jgi:hypothetical protein